MRLSLCRPTPPLVRADMGHRWGFDSLIKTAPTPQSFINNQIPSFSGGAIQVEMSIFWFCTYWYKYMECQTMHDICITHYVLYYIYINDVVIWHNDKNLITDTVRTKNTHEKARRCLSMKLHKKDKKIHQGGLWVPNSHNPHDTITGTGYIQSILLPRFHLHKVGHRHHTTIHWSAAFL